MADVTADRNAVLTPMETVRENEARPCPFCGSDRVGLRGATVFYILCLGCEASTGCYTEKAEAWDAWNRRTNSHGKHGRLIDADYLLSLIDNGDHYPTGLLDAADIYYAPTIIEAEEDPT